jgi:hypothetical protein
VVDLKSKHPSEADYGHARWDVRGGRSW